MKLIIFLPALFHQTVMAFVANRHVLHGPLSPSTNLFEVRPFQGPSTQTQFMFGGLFGGDDDKKNEDHRELALYPNLGSSDLKYDSLSDYIQKWSQLFETDPKGMQLTTKVRVLPSDVSSGSDDEDVVEFSGMRLVFKSTDTGYKSKKEEGDATKSNAEDTAPKKKKKENKQGGVEILVEKMSSDNVRVRARRCDFDEDTMIKEMSEEAIIKELQKAIEVWKRETK